ncbi:MAG: metal-dependent transcriptional regulator [Flavobacteriaceae bacterium]|nr:metal-dependent transcriptional regulator [Flavobacteriaceae bacterium]
MPTRTEENYIKTIYHFQADTNHSVSTNLIAEKLQTKASSVTDMIQKLAEKKLVSYKKYQGVLLTKAGRDVAIDVLRKHRLWEVFLSKNLGYSWDEVHCLAEQLEHIKSATLADRLDEYLGHPTHDPHGHPIPDKDGNILPQKSSTLSLLEVGDMCVVTGVNDSSSDFLRYLSKINIQLGSTMTVVSKEEFDGSMELLVDGKKTYVSSQIAKNLNVRKGE